MLCKETGITAGRMPFMIDFDILRSLRSFSRSFPAGTATIGPQCVIYVALLDVGRSKRIIN